MGFPKQRLNAKRGRNFVMKNGKMQILSVDDLEKLTGYDFFNALDCWTEYQLESSVDVSAWGWEESGM